MSSATSVLRGLVVGGGLAVIALGLRGIRFWAPRAVLRRAIPGRSGRRRTGSVGVGAVCGIAAWAIVDWPVIGIVVCVVVTRSLLRRGSGVVDEVAWVEAIATWTEQIRDTLSAAGGLQSAVVASSRRAPQPLAGPLGRLVSRLEYERLPLALHHLADEVRHPTADFVVTALVTAAEHEARDLAGLLGQLAASARAEAQMRTRVWIGRTRTRTAVRTIAVVVPLMLGAVMLVDREYLRPYDSLSGQLVLAAVVLVFAGALAAMDRLGEIRLPDRFLVRSGVAQ